MDFDNERYHSEREFYCLGEDFAHFRPFHSNPVEKKLKTLFAGLDRFALGKTVPAVSSMARGLYSFYQYRPPGQ